MHAALAFSRWASLLLSLVDLFSHTFYAISLAPIPRVPRSTGYCAPGRWFHSPSLVFSKLSPKRLSTKNLLILFTCIQPLCHSWWIAPHEYLIDGKIVFLYDGYIYPWCMKVCLEVQFQDCSSLDWSHSERTSDKYDSSWRFTNFPLITSYSQNMNQYPRRYPAKHS